MVILLSVCIHSEYHFLIIQILNRDTHEILIRNPSQAF